MSSFRFVYFTNHQYFNQSLSEIFGRFAANGATALTLDDIMLSRLLDDWQYSKVLMDALRDSGCSMVEAHGLRGEAFDLGATDDGRLERMIEVHSRAIQIASIFGARNYVMHLGAEICYQEGDLPLEAMRQGGIKALERLLVVAERSGVVIALENSFEPSNAPDEVAYLLRNFEHPNLGCCFDVGHANIMEEKEGKKIERFEHNIVRAWHGKLRMESDALGKLASDIVTVHLHDNDGYSDQHKIPCHGMGSVDWGKTMKRLREECPRLYSIQNETKQYSDCYPIELICESENWLMEQKG